MSCISQCLISIKGVLPEEWKGNSLGSDTVDTTAKKKHSFHRQFVYPSSMFNSLTCCLIEISDDSSFHTQDAAQVLYELKDNLNNSLNTEIQKLITCWNAVVERYNVEVHCVFSWFLCRRKYNMIWAELNWACICYLFKLLHCFTLFLKYTAI